MLSAEAIAKIAESVGIDLNDGVNIVRNWATANGYDPHDVITRKPFKPEQAHDLISTIVDAGYPVEYFSKLTDLIQPYVDYDPTEEAAQDESFWARAFNNAFNPDRRKHAFDARHTYSARTRTSRTSATQTETERFAADWPMIARIPI